MPHQKSAFLLWYIMYPPFTGTLVCHLVLWDSISVQSQLRARQGSLPIPERQFINEATKMVTFEECQLLTKTFRLSDIHNVSHFDNI